MGERLEDLIEKARTGGPDDALALANHLRRRVAPVAVLLPLSTADEEMLRLAAARALGGRTEPLLLVAAAGLVADVATSGARRAGPGVGGEPCVAARGRAALRLLSDAELLVRLAAAAPAGGRPSLASRLSDLLGEDRSGRCAGGGRRACRGTPEVALPALFRALAEEADELNVATTAAASLETHLARDGGWPAGVAAPRIGAVAVAAGRLSDLAPGRFPTLRRHVETRIATEVDPARLARFGTDLTAEAEAGRLPRAHGVDVACEAVLDDGHRRRRRARSCCWARPGSGKTAVAHEVVHRLAALPERPWRVLRVRPSDILAGTVYIGEWQTKVSELVEAVKAPRRVLLYVPNLRGALPGRARHQERPQRRRACSRPEWRAGRRDPRRVHARGLPRRARRPRPRSAASSRPSSSHAGRADGDPRHPATAVRGEAGADCPAPVLDRLLELAAIYSRAPRSPGAPSGSPPRDREARRTAPGPWRRATSSRRSPPPRASPWTSSTTSAPLDLDARGPSSRAGSWASPRPSRPSSTS